MLAPPLGGTLAVVPSISSAGLRTPSPETSRVIDGLSDCGDLVDFIDVDDPARAFSTL